MHSTASQQQSTAGERSERLYVGKASHELMSRLVVGLQRHRSECDRKHAGNIELETPVAKTARVHWLVTNANNVPSLHDVNVCMQIVEAARFVIVRIGGDDRGPYFDCEPTVTDTGSRAAC